MNLLKIISVLSMLLMVGCGASLIRTTAHLDNDAYAGFGRTPAREFFINKEISDSLSLKWQNSVNGGFNNSSVAIYDSLVFINDLSGRIYCFYLSNGKQIGQLKSSGSVFTTPYVNKYTLVYTVAEENENITHLYYYDYIKGKMKYDIEAAGRSVTQMIGTPDEIIFNTEDGNVYKYDMKGNEIWKIKISSSIHSSPSMKDNIIVFGNDNGEIIGIDSKTGRILYNKKTGESFFGASSISDNTVYIGNDNGNLYAVNLQKGNIIWKYNSGAKIIMTPSVTADKIYFGNLSGELFCLDKEGNLIWRTATDGILNATPFISENYLVIPDMNKKFYFVDINTGKIEKTYNVEGRLNLSPVIFRNLLFVGYDRGELQAYEFK
ncbi:MAG TPA: PQQ-binding-like beta-propeller repeat protein [Ignavibacteriaceae bacterium]|nr:PQQ-binding-like beta-propeller repeat protein [Ignavibacteriaceae bacterium]